MPLDRVEDPECLVARGGIVVAPQVPETAVPVLVHQRAKRLDGRRLESIHATVLYAERRGVVRASGAGRFTARPETLVRSREDLGSRYVSILAHSQVSTWLAARVIETRRFPWSKSTKPLAVLTARRAERRQPAA